MAALPGLLLWGGPDPLRAQPTYQLVPISLTSPLLRTTLPYREPFFLYTVSPLPLDSVRAGVRPWTRSLDQGTKPETERCDFAADSLRWSARPLVARGGSAPDDTLFVLVPEVRANQRYVFCLHTEAVLAGEPLTRFQTAAARLLDDSLRAFQRRAGTEPVAVTDSVLAILRKGYVRSLSALTRRRAEPRGGGTTFDTLAPGLPPGPRSALSQIISAQNRRLVEIGNFQTHLASGAALLDGLSRSASLAGVLALDPAKKPVPGLTAGQLAEAQAVAAFLRVMTPAERDAILAGEMIPAPGSVPPARPLPLAEAWDASALEPRMLHLQQTTMRLQALRAVAASMERPAAGGRAGAAEGTTFGDSLQVASNLVLLQRGVLDKLAEALSSRAKRIEEASREVGSRAETDVALLATSILDFVARAQSSINADLGVAYAPGLDQVFPYFGVNFYLGAINKRVPLRYAGGFRDRFALTLGVGASSLARAGDRDDLFSSFSVLFGGGFRIADPIRVTGGGVLLREVPRNPLQSGRPVRVTPFFSLSLDYDVRSVLGKLGDKLF